MICSAVTFGFSQVFHMSLKMKGIRKSFKYITQIFGNAIVSPTVAKEREIEIGYPTDVKHVAHIGWDGASGNAPTWMNEFKTAPDHFSATSFGNMSDRKDSNSTAVTALTAWSSQDFDQQITRQPATDLFRDLQLTQPPLPSASTKPKRKKNRSISSPKSPSSSSRSSVRNPPQ